MRRPTRRSNNGPHMALNLCGTGGSNVKQLASDEDNNGVKVKNKKTSKRKSQTESGEGIDSATNGAGKKKNVNGSEDADDSMYKEATIYGMIMEDLLGHDLNQKLQLVKKCHEFVRVATEMAVVNNNINIDAIDKAIEVMRNHSNRRRVPTSIERPRTNRRSVRAPVGTVNRSISMGSAEDVLGLGPQMANCKAKVETERREMEEPQGDGSSLVYGRERREETIQIPEGMDSARIEELIRKGFNWVSEPVQMEDVDDDVIVIDDESDEGHPIIEEIE